MKGHLATLLTCPATKIREASNGMDLEFKRAQPES